MPLPEGENTPWPPKPYRDAFDHMAQWSAWYSGNPDELSNVYERVGQRMVNRPQVRPSQMRGGLVGTLARWFWGQPIATGEKRTKLHVPIASDIAATSADLLFSEPVTVTSEDAKTQAQLEELLGDTMHAQLLESAEVAAGLGGVYLRSVWDRDVQPDGPWLSAVHADAAVPEWSYGRLTAVTIWRELVRNGREVIRHLERHEPGVILHGVYVGDETTLGRAVPLSEFPDTEALVDAVQDGNRIETGIEQLTAAYIPNMRPNRLWRNHPASCHLGRSDYAGGESLMDALDEVYTSWLRDVRLAKGRVFVPEVYLQDRGPGRGAYFDPDREIYETLNMLPGGDGKQQITLSQFEIRVEEHSKTALELVNRIVSTAGYSGQTFGLTGEVAITATEVAARERKSLITRDKKIRYWRPELAGMFEVLLALGAVHFGWAVSPEKPMVEFPDAVQPDQASVAQTLQLLESARSISIDQKVRMLHPDWEDPEVAAEVERIKDETGGGPLEDPGTFRDANEPPTKPEEV